MWIQLYETAGVDSSAHQINQVEKHCSGNVKTCRVLARCQALGSNLCMDYISDSGHDPSTNEQLAKESEKAAHSFLSNHIAEVASDFPLLTSKYNAMCFRIQSI